MTKAQNGRALPIWFSSDELRRLEDGMALAGESNRSRFIRDRVLGGSDSARALASLSEAVEEIAFRVDRVEEMLAISLYLSARKAGTGDMQGLREAVRAKSLLNEFRAFLKD